MRALTMLLLLPALSGADDWPQWMGPNRDGIWTESGILEKFPESGPKLLWAKPLGGGYSGPAVAGGRVFVMDYQIQAGNPLPDPAKRNQLQGNERVVCFDAASGQELWVHSYNCPYNVSYPAGPRCTPTVNEGKVYALGTMGQFHCLNAADGKPVWSSDFPARFAAKVPIWGFTGHPLIYKNLVICLVGGPEALLVAFDKNNGAMKWQALKTPHDDGPGYCPPSIIQAGGVAQLLIWHPQAIVSLDPETGKVYWREEVRPSHGMSIIMPRREGNILYVAGFMNAALTLKLDDKEPKASVHWRGTRNSAIYPANSTPLIDGETIYGCDAYGYLRAARLSNGERLWESTEPIVGVAGKPMPHGTAFLTRNDNRYFLFNEKGHLLIARLTPEKYELVADAALLEPTTSAFNRTVVWSHPAYADKAVFVRNDKTIKCFSLAK